MDTQQFNTSSNADEEAVNKVVEKIETLRMGPRQVIRKFFDWNVCYMRDFIHIRNMKWMNQLARLAQSSSLKICPIPTRKSFQGKSSTFSRARQSNRASPKNKVKSHRSRRFIYISCVWSSHLVRAIKKKFFLKCSYTDFYKENEKETLIKFKLIKEIKIKNALS